MKNVFTIMVVCVLCTQATFIRSMEYNDRLSLMRNCQQINKLHARKVREMTEDMEKLNIQRGKFARCLAMVDILVKEEPQDMNGYNLEALISSLKGAIRQYQDGMSPEEFAVNENCVMLLQDFKTFKKMRDIVETMSKGLKLEQ